MIQKHHHPVYTWFDKTLQEATFRFPRIASYIKGNQCIKNRHSTGMRMKR